MIRLEEANLKRLVSRIGLVNTKKLIYLLKADKLSIDRDVSFLNEKLEEVEKLGQEEAVISLKELKIDGNDLIKLGYKDKEIGKVLDFLFSAYLENKVENDKEKLIKYLGDTYEQKRKEKKSISEKD
jgi:tRNA nucleotidyltransferase (CCA-adding enzyme)